MTGQELELIHFLQRYAVAGYLRGRGIRQRDTTRWRFSGRSLFLDETELPATVVGAIWDGTWIWADTEPGYSDYDTEAAAHLRDLLRAEQVPEADLDSFGLTELGAYLLAWAGCEATDQAGFYSVPLERGRMFLLLRDGPDSSALPHQTLLEISELFNMVGNPFRPYIEGWCARSGYQFDGDEELRVRSGDADFVFCFDLERNRLTGMYSGAPGFTPREMGSGPDT